MFMSKTLLPILFLSLLAAFSCDQSKDSPTRPSGKLNGMQKFYYPDGELYLEGSFKDSIPQGLFKQYFKNGQLFEEAPYENGVLHGTLRRYFENGKLSMEIPYDSGKVHGVKKKFRKDGTIAYEAPFFLDQPCVGLKEYFLSGKVVDNYPKILVTEENQTLKENRFSLRLKMSKPGKVSWYTGSLTNGKYIGKDAEAVYTERDGSGRIDFLLPPGAVIMESVNTIAKYKTDLGNFHITQQKYNVGVENW